MTSHRRNQRDRMLDALIEAHPNEVSSIDMGRIALHYSARIVELRRQGYVITNRTEHQSDGRVFGFYRIDLAASNPTVPSLPKPPQRQQQMLFELTESHKDLG